MAEFTLSTKRSKSGGGSRGLQNQLLGPNTLSGLNLNAGRIDPNAGQIGYTNAPIPNTVEDQTSKGIQTFMGATAEAAFQYQEREAKYQASQAVLHYSEIARKAYSGYEDADGNYVPGYASQQGDAARTAFPTFQGGLEGAFEDMTEGMEPRVKQHALIGMQNAKNQAMAKASTHRVTQLKLAEEEQRVKKRTNVVNAIAANPKLLIPGQDGKLPVTNPLTGGNIVNDYYDTFLSGEEANDAWVTTLQQITEKIYLESPKTNNGEYKSADARAFLDYIARPRMLAAGEEGIKTYTTISNTLRGWELREVQNDLAKETRDRQEAERRRKLAQEDKLAEGLSKAGTKDAWSQSDWRNEIATGGVEPTKGNSAMLYSFGETIKAADNDDLHRWTVNIESSFIKDGVRVFRNHEGELEPLNGAWHGDDAVNKDSGAMSFLTQLYTKVHETNYTDVTAIMGEINKAYENKFGINYLTMQAGPALRLHRMQVELWASENKDRQEMRALAREQLFPDSEVALLKDLKGIHGLVTQPKFEDLDKWAARIEDRKDADGIRAYRLRREQLIAYRRAFKAEEEAEQARKANMERLKND
jgi:hypothetical protein